MNAMKWMIGCALIIGVGCQAATTSSDDAKPTVDPDVELSGKADGLSNHYTTVMGELPLNDVVFGEIDYPDYFHGYTIDLEEGQTIQFTTWADAGGLVRLYGPGNETSRGLKYGRAAVRSHTSYRGDRHQAEFELDVEESGTYMLIYGPDYVWHSSYELSTKCIVGCDDVAEIKVADVLADPAGYDGKRVRITGNVFAGPAFCTLLACTPENPCCNSCGASQLLSDGSGPNSPGIGLQQHGDRFSCGGDECTVGSNCTVDDGRYKVVGTVVVDRFETYIDIETIDAVTATCSDHSDCADGWCRQTDWDNSSPSECVAFVGEGESCGGFAPPQYINACDPALTCVYRPFIADAPGRCRNVATVAELEANPAAYEGKRVSIDGYLNTSYAICTQMACTQENPCCNSCGASQKLDDHQLTTNGGLELIGADGGTYGCGGNNCDYADNCTVDEDGKVRVLGTLEVGEFGQLIFSVEEIEPLEHL